MSDPTPTDLVPAEQRAELRARLSWASPADADTAYRCMGAPLLANDPAMFLRLLDLEDEVGLLRGETSPKRRAMAARIVELEAEVSRLRAALQVCGYVLHRAEPTDAQSHAGQQAAGAYADEDWSADRVYDDLPDFVYPELDDA